MSATCSAPYLLNRPDPVRARVYAEPQITNEERQQQLRRQAAAALPVAPIGNDYSNLRIFVIARSLEQRLRRLSALVPAADRRIRAVAGRDCRPSARRSRTAQSSEAQPSPDVASTFAETGDPRKPHPGDILYWIACLGGVCLLLLSATT